MTKISTTPTWQQDVTFPESETLTSDTDCDVVIVGGGLTGLLCAYMVARAGKSVIVLEANRIGAGVTAYTTAFLTQLIDTSMSEQVTYFGKERAKLIWDSHGAAIDLIEQIARDEHIDCEFMRCDSWCFANGKRQYRTLQDEYENMWRLELPVQLQERANLQFRNEAVLRLPNQAKFHPLKFLRGLLAAAQNEGVRIYEHSEVTDITSDSGVLVEANGQVVRAGVVVISTYDPPDLKPELLMRKAMYTTYIYEVQLPGGTLAEGLYQDAGNPYHYFRVDALGDHDRMIIGGEDNRQEAAFHEEKNYRALAVYLDLLLPGKRYTIKRQWSGPILEPSDGLALIGEIRPKQYVATAFSGNGMTYAAIAAVLLRDLIIRKPNNLEGIYDPRREVALGLWLQKGVDFVQEFISAAGRNTLLYW